MLKVYRWQSLLHIACGCLKYLGCFLKSWIPQNAFSPTCYVKCLLYCSTLAVIIFTSKTQSKNFLLLPHEFLYSFTFWMFRFDFGCFHFCSLSWSLLSSKSPWISSWRRFQISQKPFPIKLDPITSPKLHSVLRFWSFDVGWELFLYLIHLILINRHCMFVGVHIYS